MKPLLSLLAPALAGALSMGMAHATTPAQATQQSKMKACNAQAKTDALKGDARQTFMKTCLSKQSDAPVAAAPTQQTKMKTCNTEATGKKGAERKAFMKECLSK